MTSAEAYVLSKQLIQRRFSRKATRREIDTSVEDEIGTRLLEHLDPVKAMPRRVLDLGTGTGVGLSALSRRYPQAEITGLDFSLPMLKAAAKRLSERVTNINFVCADIEQTGLASSSFDLLYSNLTLNWCNDFDAAIGEFHRLLRPGGLLTLSVLGPDTLCELRESWAQVDEQPHVHRFPDMHDIGDSLQRTGFADVVVDAERLTLEYQTMARLLTDLRDWGVGNVCRGRKNSLTGRARFEAMKAGYERLRNTNNALPASCEVAYVHAWLPERRGAIIPVADFNPLRRRR